MRGPILARLADKNESFGLRLELVYVVSLIEAEDADREAAVLLDIACADDEPTELRERALSAVPQVSRWDAALLAPLVDPRTAEGRYRREKLAQMAGASARDGDEYAKELRREAASLLELVGVETGDGVSH